MALAYEGKLSLDDPVSKYLPEFSGDKAGITVRHLFSHTSGLPPEARCRNDKRTTLERCANEIAGLQLRAKPGTDFYYGGAAMHVGQTFSRTDQLRIRGPKEMRAVLRRITRDSCR